MTPWPGETGSVRTPIRPVSPVVASTLTSTSRTVVSGLDVPDPAEVPVVTVSKAPTSWTEMILPGSHVYPVFESEAVPARHPV